MSSPIVSGDRVFVTTSFKSRRTARIIKFVAIAGPSLVVMVLLGWLIRWYQTRRRYQRKLPSPWPRDRGAWAEEVFTLLLVLVFLSLSVAISLIPKRLDTWLDTVGQGMGKTWPNLEKLVTIDPGVDAGVWLTGGTLGLVGLALVAWTLRGLVWRLVMAGAVTVGAWKLCQGTPPDEWLEPIALGQRLMFAMPGLLLAWLAIPDCFEGRLTPARISEDPGVTHGLRALEIRLRNRYLLQPGEFGTVLAAVALFLLAGLVFIPGNYLLNNQDVDRGVLCLDAQSGEILWERVVWTDLTERRHSDNSYATPTCAADGQHVLAFFGGILTCLDYEGTVQWQQLDETYIRHTKYGSSSSPIIVNGLGIVLQGKEDRSGRPAWLAAFDMATGQPHWRIEPPDIGEGYTTPLVHGAGETAQLLIPSEKRINSYRVSDGQRLWTLDNPIDQIVASLVKTGNTLVAGGGTFGPKAVVALELSDTPEQAPRLLWQAKFGAPGCSSPVIVDNRLYLLDDRGLFTCYDVHEGILLWRQRLKGRHLASLAAGDGKVYAVSTKGHTSVLDLQGQGAILARNSLPGKCHASPALMPGHIILRVGDSLYCIAGTNDRS